MKDLKVTTASGDMVKETEFEFGALRIEGTQNDMKLIISAKDFLKFNVQVKLTPERALGLSAGLHRMLFPDDRTGLK